MFDATIQNRIETADVKIGDLLSEIDSVLDDAPGGYPGRPALERARKALAAAHLAAGDAKIAGSANRARAIDARYYDDGLVRPVGEEIDDWRDFVEEALRDGWAIERVDGLFGWAPYTALYRMTSTRALDERFQYYAVEEER